MCFPPSPGHYLLINTADRTKGDKAQMYSEVLPATQASCLSFYLRMYQGNDAGSVSLYFDDDVAASDPSGHWTNLWSFNQPQGIGSDWMLQQVNCTLLNVIMLIRDYNIRFILEFYHLIIISFCYII